MYFDQNRKQKVEIWYSFFSINISAYLLPLCNDRQVCLPKRPHFSSYSCILSRIECKEVKCKWQNEYIINVVIISVFYFFTLYNPNTIIRGKFEPIRQNGNKLEKLSYEKMKFLFCTYFYTFWCWYNEAFMA